MRCKSSSSPTSYPTSQAMSFSSDSLPQRGSACWLSSGLGPAVPAVLQPLTMDWSGIACMCQGVVNNTSGLFACRFFMGLCEGGFVPGCAYLLSMYYKRHEFQKRYSLLWAAGLVAGAFGGLLAYALYHMHNLGGDSGWRWVFIIGGLAVNCIGFVGQVSYCRLDWKSEVPE